MSGFRETALLIAATDLDGFTAEASRRPDLDVADGIHRYYELATDAVENAGGRVVKYLGDACLATFSPECADGGVGALMNLKADCDAMMRRLGWKVSLGVRAHYGTVAEGQFGKGASRRHDILGRNVNLTFRLASRGVALSAEAFRRLTPARRQLFKKHSTPVTYIPVPDPHPPRWRS